MRDSSYNIVVDRLQKFAEGHFYIKSFAHDTLDALDTTKSIEYPIMQVIPGTMTPSQGQVAYSFDIVFADLARRKTDLELNTREIISDMTRIALDLLVEIKNGQVLFGSDVQVEQGSVITSFIDGYENTITGVTLAITIIVQDTWNACIIPADWSTGGTGYPSEGMRVTSIPVLDEGNFVVNAYEIDFRGSGVTVTRTGNTAIVTITGGGAGGGLTCEDLPTCQTIIDIEANIDAIESDVTALQGNVSDLQNDVTDLQNDKVPYTGATGDVDLGVYGIKTTEFVDFNTAPTNTPQEARLIWNDVDGTMDLGLKGGNVTLQIGQEEVIRVINKSGGDLLESEYKVVRIRTVAEGGAQGQRLAVVRARADTKANHTGILGLVTEDIGNNQEGFITSYGNVRNINTTGSLQGESWSDGDVLWLSESVAGGLTNIKPTNHPVQIGYVVYAHANNGKIFVKVDEGVDELSELHDVDVVNPIDGQWLEYNGTKWENTGTFNYSINFKDVEQYSIILPYNWRIVSIGSNPSALSVTIEKNGSAYTLDTNINANTDEITVDVNAVGFINLICRIV